MADIVKFKKGERPVFQLGQTLEKGNERVFVLAVEDGGNCAVLVSLEPERSPLRPRKPTFSATTRDMVGWKPLYMPGPRLVQAFDKHSHALVWEAYVPGIVEALHLADEVYQPEPPYLDADRPIDLVIHAQHDDEVEMLLQTGYWPEGTVPAWWPDQ